MKRLKLIIISMLIGLLLGLWFGVNLGRGQPVYSNPFAAKPVHRKLLESGGDALEKSGRALKEQFAD